MKKLSFLSLLLIAFTGCQIEELETPVQETIPENEMATYYVGIDSDIETRTSLSNEGKILWSVGDKMNIFFGVNNNSKDALVLMRGEGTEDGSFYGPYIASTDLNNLHQTVIVYPYDENMTCTPNDDKTVFQINTTLKSVQQYTEGSFANGAYPMVGVTENLKEVVVKTKNVVSGMNLKLKGDASISKIVLSSDNLALAGPATIEASYGNAPVVTVEESTALNTVELVCDGVQLNPSTETEFYLTFAPCSGKITVTIYDTEGGYMSRTTKATEFTRNDIFQLPVLNYTAEHNVIDDLKKAFKNGGEYTLPVDVTVTEQLLISGATKKLNLDLNGNTLTCNTDLTGTSGSIHTTGAELNISNGTIVNKAGYFFVTNGYNDNLHLELTDVDVKGSATAVFYFADGTDIVLNNVNVNVSGKGFYSFSKNHNGTILINGGTYKTSGKVFDFTSNLPVTFVGNCLFTDKSYAGVDWVESGDAAYPWKPVGHKVLVGTKGYYSLSDAVAAVEDGQTITLASDEVFTETNRTHNSGSWYDGLYYVGDKSFTIDLGGFTISQDGAVNDYLLNFKNNGSKPNVITLKNGTLDAGKTAFCALATSSSNTQKMTINLENINLINNISNGAVIKFRGGCELNVNAGTVITGMDSYTGIEAVGNNTVVNIYEGAEIYQNGTSSYLGAIVGASYNSTLNIYGGKGKSAKCGIIVMSTGATINVSGGEWIANGDGTVAGDNQAVLVSQNNRNESGWVCKSILNVTGGTFKGGYNCYGMGPGVEADDAQINISGGIFNAKPAESYLEDGYSAVENEENGTWVISKMPAVTINGVQYYSFEEALENAPSGATLALYRDIKVTEPIVVESGKTITLDLNGKTINAPESSALQANTGSKLLVKNGNVNALEAVVRAVGGEVVIESGTYVQTGFYPATYRYAIDCRTDDNANVGKVTVNGGEFASNNGLINAGGEITINGGKFTNKIEVAATRHMMYVNGSAVVNINGGEFHGVANSSAGGEHICVYTKNAQVNIAGGSFTSVWSSGSANSIISEYSSGSAICVTGGDFNTNKGLTKYVSSDCKVIEKDGRWVVEVAPATVGGVAYDTVAEAIAAAQEGQTVTVKAGEYKFPASSLKAGVTVECEEGTVFTGSSSLNVKGATIVGATFSNESGSIINQSRVDGTFKNCRFEGKTALRAGYVGETCVFEDCYFKENGSNWVFHFDGAATGVANSEIICRRCTFDGKRVALAGTIKNLVMEDCVFVNGDYINTYNTATFTNCSFGTNRVSPLGSHVTYKNCTMNGASFTIDNITFFNGYPCKVTVDSEDFAFVSDSNALKNAVKNYDNITVILSHKYVYTGEYDFTGKANMTLRPYPGHSPKIEGLVWADNCNVTLKGLTLSNPNGVQHPNPGNSKYYNTINNQYPLIGAYTNADIKVVDCTMNLTGPTVYGFYGYAHNTPVFEGCTFNCNKIRPIANNGDSITVTGCTFVDQYHYSVRIFENQGERQTVVYTNNTVTGTNDKGEFEGVNISKKGDPATIFADFTINGNTEGLKYRHHKAVTMDPSCTYDVTGFAFEKEN